MTKKTMLINVADDESRVAIVEDSLLQEMLIEHRTKEQIKNNIYKATVVQIQTSLQAAFVDFGNKKHGFLPSSEIHPNLFYRKNATPNSPIQHKIKQGQSFLVQVTRESVDHKGAALTTNITIPGRFMVLMPNSSKGGVSKKIESQEERDRLKSFLSGIESERHAVIIRTAGLGRDLNDLKKDYTTLKKSWEEVQETFKAIKKPGLVLEEADVVTRTLRDYYTEDIEEIWVDNPDIFQKVLDFIKLAAPRKQKSLKLFVGDRSLFSTYHVERQVEQLSSREVKLMSGGSVVIEQTEALVSIDVNSGKSNQEADIDSTALRTNLEAANEIARQVRLRNLGGLIVVDFIDMERDDARKKVETELKNAMERDKAHRKYNPISQFGLLEFSRQRLAIGISSTVESVCPTCAGKGRITSLLASTNLIIRAIREMAASTDIARVEGDLPLELANSLLNERRQSIADLELEFGIKILLRGNPNVAIFEEKQLRAISLSGQIIKTAVSEAEKDARKENSKRKRRKDKDRERPSADDKQTLDIQEAAEKTETQSSRSKKPDKETPETPEVEPEIVPEETVLQEPTEVEVKVEEVVIVESPVAVEAAAEISIGASVKTETDGIHPACLFTDVKELNSEELEEVTSNFESRLRGKAVDKPNPIIDSRFLWKNKPQASLPEEDHATIEIEVPDDAQPESLGVIETQTEEIAPDAETQPENEIREQVEEKPQKKSRRGSARRRSSSKKTQKKPVEESAQNEDSAYKKDMGSANQPSEEEQSSTDSKSPEEKTEAEPKKKKACSASSNFDGEKTVTDPEKDPAESTTKKKTTTRTRKKRTTKDKAADSTSKTKSGDKKAPKSPEIETED